MATENTCEITIPNDIDPLSAKDAKAQVMSAISGVADGGSVQLEIAVGRPSVLAQQLAFASHKALISKSINVSLDSNLVNLFGLKGEETGSKNQ